MSTEKLPGLPLPAHDAVILSTRSEKVRLLTVIDTEEEFDWSKPFDCNATSVTHVNELYRVQDIFDKERLIPTYIIDYPIAATEQSAKLFRALATSGQAEIGAQLHPWVTPPIDEVINPFNSYPGNLPFALEKEKLATLCRVIESQIGIRPRTYKAGRYGMSHQSLTILHELGFTVDTSAMPGFDLRADGGPNYLHYPSHTHWQYDRKILEIPTTGGFIGSCRRIGPALHRISESSMGRAVRLGGILSRLNINARIRLSPEGFTLRELQALTRALYSKGDRLFSLNFHSPSVGVGHTRYTQSSAERDKFLAVIRDYIRWFKHDFGGTYSTPQTIYNTLIAPTF